MPQPSNPSPYTRTFFNFLLLLIFALSLTGTLLTATTLGIHAEGTTRTVCASGPPTCDYVSIQAAIDASSTGDEILVQAGVYTEALTLRDHISIHGSESATTTLTAAAGSIILASDVTSVTFSHLVLDGRGVLKSGMSLTSVDITLDHIVIRNLTGKDGSSPDSPHGDDVIGLSLSGIGSLNASNLQIQRLAAGNGLDQHSYDLQLSYRGGNATGILVDGTYDVSIESSSITDLTAGDAGNAFHYAYSCSGEGGHAVGIGARSSNIRLDTFELRNIRAGAPCYGYNRLCQENPGTFVGINVDGGRLTVLNSLLDGLYASYSRSPNTAIKARGAESVAIQNLQIDHGVIDIPGELNTGIHGASVNSPFCLPPPLSVHSLSIEDANLVDLKRLDIRNVIGYGGFGKGAAIVIKDVDTVSLQESVIRNVHGGHGKLTAHGIYLARIEQLLIDATAINSVEAQASDNSFGFYGIYSDGGSAAALTLNNVNSGAITGVSVWRVVGGDVTDNAIGCGDRCPALSGGDASGIVLKNSSADLVHNTVMATTPGLADRPHSQDGTGYGIVSDDADVFVAATIVARHVVGLANHSGTMAVEQVNLWDNDINYSGVNPSPTDLYVDPGLMGKDDIHLRANSELIDRAGDYGAFSRMPDIDGQPRPLDGNGDGIYKADIGADERYMAEEILHVQAMPGRAATGESIHALAVIENPSSVISQTGVVFESTVPEGLVFVPGSLHAFSGDAGILSTDGVEQVVWTGDLPAENAVTIRYDLLVTADTSTNESVILQADTTGDNAEMDRHAEVDILLNPPQIHLPQIQYGTN